MYVFGNKQTNTNNTNTIVKVAIRNTMIQNNIKNNAIRNSVIRHNSQIKNKIICVGQPKTGTKTLKKIFEQLGKKGSGAPQCFLRNNNDYTTINNIPIDTNNFFNNISYLDKHLEMFDFFHDVPYSFNYELIDKKYPDSKFILTIRDEEDWFKSLFHYQNLPLPEASPRKIINAIYHHEIIMSEHKAEVIELYRKYNNDVITYFTDTPEKLLIIDLCDKNKNEPDIIQKISGFTKLVIPGNFVFPHENNQKYK